MRASKLKWKVPHWDRLKMLKEYLDHRKKFKNKKKNCRKVSRNECNTLLYLHCLVCVLFFAAMTHFPPQVSLNFHLIYPKTSSSLHRMFEIQCILISYISFKSLVIGRTCLFSYLKELQYSKWYFTFPY